jgi:hypothetical protein
VKERGVIGGETGIRIRRSRSRDTSCTLQNDLGNRVESRFRVVRISFGKKIQCVSGCIRVGGVGDKPRKDARIFAAFSASPGKLNPCANDCDDDCTRLEPSFMNAEAWIPALTAPFLNLSSTDIVNLMEGNCRAAV